MITTSYINGRGEKVTFPATTAIKPGEIIYSNRSKNAKWDERGFYYQTYKIHQRVETVQRRTY